jgi:hypothetical protein
MDNRVELIKEFYHGLPTDRMKLETFHYGFGFLEKLLTDGIVLRYGERYITGRFYKYKLANVPEARIDGLLLAHVRKECNVCLYFQSDANGLFCFNLDINHKVNNTVMIPEMALAIALLREMLAGAGCEPLVIASGRGYHCWCRLAAPVSNETLHKFMLGAMARTFYGLQQNGMDHRKIKANFYPDPRTQDTVSLRLFGTEHMNTKLFSQVLTRAGLLDEEGSWKAFEAHLRRHAISAEVFEAACASMTSAA